MKRKHTHVGAYAIISNGKEILLILKARGGYASKLDLPGGGIEHTETPNEALAREVGEEAGLTVLDYSLLDAISANICWKVKDDFYEDLHHIGIIYLVNKYNGNVKTTSDGLDSLGAKWYKISDLDLDKLSPFAKYAVNYLRSK